MCNAALRRVAVLGWILLAIATGCSSTSTVVGDGAQAAVSSSDAPVVTAPPPVPAAAIGQTFAPYSAVPNGACAVHQDDNSGLVVPCDSPHDFQKYAVAENPSGAYPGADVLLASCYPYFLDFAGVPIGESGLYGEGWYPTESDWARGDYGVECLIWFEASVSGSLPDLDLAAGFNGRIPWASVTADTCVATAWDINAVSVGTTDCAEELSIDILGLVSDGDVIDVEACSQLADAAGYPAGIVERSSLLVIRGFDQSICYAEVVPTTVSG